ncbi:GNAT family N-acetyltransferase [Rhodococcus sp. NPDC003318]|uniref:GNAT family N-acetyltransferase n=1 Tax=Rhodococcus sp. NPDC003318 TaxID=3364503 RepID=UPI0036A39779
MDSHQLDIVSLAWCRELGLPDDALRRPGTRTVGPATDTIRFVRLGGASALIGPEWLLARAADVTDETLASRSTLVELTRDHGGRCTGPRLLAYASEVHADIDVDNPLISHVLPHVQALQSLCPPDDVAEADLTSRRNWFTLLDEDENPLAGAGYAEWQGIVARVAVLTAPGTRRCGHGSVVGRLCTNDAIDEGMIPQWSSDPGNTPSRRLAARLGFEELGSVTEITLAAP